VATRFLARPLSSTPRARRAVLPVALPVALAVATALALGGCTPSPGADPGASTSPAPEPPAASPASPTPTPTPITVDPAFTALETQYGARLGVIAIDTGTGASVEWRADDRFAYASTHKALSAAALLDEVGVAGLTEAIAISADDLVTYSPVTELHVGSTLTLGELAAAAAQQSDNTAANLIMERLGGPASFDALLEAQGDAVTEVARLEPEMTEATPGDTRDTTTPRAFADDLRTYALGEVLTPNERETLVGWMTGSTTGNTLIRAGVPAGWTVADKSGAARYGTRNDIAVIWPPDGAPIVMAVMSSRDAEDAVRNDQLIADAARTAVDLLR